MMNGHSRNRALILLAVLLVAACQPTHTVEVRPLANTALVNAEPEKGSYYQLGKTHLAAADYGLAIDAFRKSLQLEENRVAAFNALAITYDMLGRFDLSQKYYEKALEIEPRSPLTFSNLAYSQHLQGENENAVRLADMAELLISGEDEGAAMALAKAVTGNLRLAEQAQGAVTEEPSVPVIPAERYAVERVGERSWEVVHKAVITKRKPLKYKASFSVNSIISKAATTKPAAKEEVAIVKPGIKPIFRPKDTVVEAQEERTIEAAVQRTPLPGHKPIYTLSYRILNATGRPFMAKRMTRFMQDQGLRVFAYANAGYFGKEQSVIEYAPGQQAKAREMAKRLPLPVELIESGNLSADVVLTLGNDLLPFDSSLEKRHFDI